MNTTDFKKQAEDLVYKEVAKSTNQILGKNKTAALSTGLFLKLPVIIEVSQVKEPLPPLRVEFTSFLERFSAYTKMGDNVNVYFTFMYYEEKELDKILDLIVRHRMFMGFVYIHEVQHVLRRHITSNYNNMMLRIADGLMAPHQAINIAEDHAINYSIKDLFKEAGLLNDWKIFEPTMCYKTEYHDKKMSDIDILKDMKSNAQPITIQQLNDLFQKVMQGDSSSIQPIPGTIDSNGNGDSNDSKGKTDTSGDDIDISINDLAVALQDTLQTHTKGTKSGELLDQLFEAIKIETGWFKKIKASFKRQVYYKTHDYSTSWANLNTTYRHIYKAPKKKFIDDKINMILSVDHSGSVSTEELQKLLYLIESEAKKISSITVLIHDTRIIKEFTLSDDYDISESPQFKEALSHRYAAGGTSHACVFEHIQNMKIPDIGKVIYMSYSDNYSDIEQVFKDYPIMRKLTNYWICTESNPMKVHGTNITMI